MRFGKYLYFCTYMLNLTINIALDIQILNMLPHVLLVLVIISLGVVLWYQVKAGKQLKSELQMLDKVGKPLNMISVKRTVSIWLALMA